MTSDTDITRRAALALLFTASSATMAWAHAHLVQAVPAADSTVHTAPDHIEITFNENVEPAFSSIELLNQNGDHLEQGKAEVAPANGKILRIALKPLAPGKYKVVWRVVSVDTHPSKGSFSFTFAP